MSEYLCRQVSTPFLLDVQLPGLLEGLMNEGEAMALLRHLREHDGSEEEEEAGLVARISQ